MQISFDTVRGSEHGDGGVAHGALLARLAEVMWRNDPEELAGLRDQATTVLGGVALVDAVAVSANFHMMTRIADGTGTPLDHGSVAPTEIIRQTIEVNDYLSRRHTPPRPS
ncbi:MAG: hypothetical protein ACKVWR_07095 [Acidimicrobiales bacterium]